MATIDPKLFDYCNTDRQREILQSIIDHGSGRASDNALGLSNDKSNRTLRHVKMFAAKAGYSPDHDMTHVVPEGYAIKRISTNYANGNIAQQWVISEPSKEEAYNAYKAAVDALNESVVRSDPVPAPSHTNAALCNLYTLTDSHVGALCWRHEGGADWDLSIAEKTLIGCFAEMIKASANADTAIVNQLGDFLHFDGLEAITPTSKHLLDADGRFTKVVQVSVRILRAVVNMALEKHNRVHVIMAEGNHDISSSVWLRTLFAALYENEPRITIEQSPLPYYAFKHGSTMLAFHHGHLKRPDALPLLFASQFPEIWGCTTKRIAHVGHRHHQEMKEHSGMTVVEHATLAARDAYAARGGWYAGRKATLYTYHEKHGEVASITVTPEMLED